MKFNTLEDLNGEPPVYFINLLLFFYIATLESGPFLKQACGSSQWIPPNALFPGIWFPFVKEKITNTTKLLEIIQKQVYQKEDSLPP
jgi:hypothetical protein